MTFKDFIRRWSYKLQNIASKDTKSFCTSQCNVEVIPFNYRGRKKRIFKKLVIGLKKRDIIFVSSSVR